MLRGICSIFGLFSILIFFIGCRSSPKNDGTQAAKEVSAAQRFELENLKEGYRNFLRDFDIQDYATRAEAWEALENIEECASQKAKKRLKAAKQTCERLRKKHLRNNKSASEFEYAYKTYLATHNTTFDDDNDYILLQQQVEERIYDIIPTNPSNRQIERDLIGHTLRDRPDGYLAAGFSNWQLTITENAVTNLEILKKEKRLGNRSQDEYFFELAFVLVSEGGGQYKVNATITYVLGRNDWEIEFLETKSIQVIKTHKYDNCVSYSLTESLFGKYLEFRNHCDMSLLVGGVYLDYRGEWRKFAFIIEANATHSRHFAEQEYKINFVERP